MPKPVVQRLTAWSFSRWKDYEKCPRLAKRKHIDKAKEIDVNPAMLRGGEIDKKAEQYLKGELKKLPVELQSFDKEFAALKKLKPQTQENWAFTKEWLQVDWFHQSVWLRVKMDAAALIKKVARVIDFKTGKPYDDHKLQTELYAMAAFMVFPKAEVAETNLWYTDIGKEDPKTFTRDQLPELQEKWVDRTKPMLTDTRFAPKPGPHCSRCFDSKSKGGTCQY